MKTSIKLSLAMIADHQKIIRLLGMGCMPGGGGLVAEQVHVGVYAASLCGAPVHEVLEVLSKNLRASQARWGCLPCSKFCTSGRQN